MLGRWTHDFEYSTIVRQTRRTTIGEVVEQPDVIEDDRSICRTQRCCHGSFLLKEYHGSRFSGASSVPAGAGQQDWQLSLFFAPRLTSRAMVSGNGETLWIGPLAISAVVCPLRLFAFTSAPRLTR